ncbi:MULTISPECIES: hypothetical protein [unclassified Streptomyces]|uniref:hypothetical protein n=1 Tax=unclassified Streptomyces TaxID=2593676 RepID=UPI0036407D62
MKSDSSRRRDIADAAGGFSIRAATVVLYACIAPGQDQQDVLARLRAHARARDWHIVGEVFDHAATDTPRENRANWRQASALITSGRAMGLVTTSRTACADTPGSPALASWLQEHQAFLSEGEPERVAQ